MLCFKKIGDNLFPQVKKCFFFDYFRIVNNNNYCFKCKRELKIINKDMIQQAYHINDISQNSVDGSVARILSFCALLKNFFYSSKFLLKK